MTAETSARPAVTPGQVWRAVRAPAIIAAAIVVAAIALAAATGTVRGGALYPDSARPAGAMALAELLRDRDVEVVRRPAFSGQVAQTVFVPVPDLVDPDDLGNVGRIGGPADVVLVAPSRAQLVALGLAWVDADPVRPVAERDVEPACDLPEAVAAGVAHLGGTTYDGPGAAVGCYSTGGAASLLVYERDSVRVTIVGTGAPFANEQLDRQGNAALALGLLSRHPQLEWLQPRLSELGGSDQPRSGLLGLLPRGVRWAVAELAVAALLAMAWRGRRLGPVVVEPLPVAVRAAEAVEGQARLYHAAHARERAAGILRAGVRARLGRALGLTPDADRAAVVPVVASRVRRDAVAVDHLLYGPPPPDDPALVRLASELDSLDHEVRQP